MRATLATSNVIVQAKFFNPSVFRESWLLRNNFAQPEDLLPGCVFSEQVANILCPSFSLLVVPPQLQFGPTDPSAEGAAATLGSMLDLLSHTPYTALGVNFIWNLDPAPEDLPSVTRALFAASGLPFVNKHFSNADASFGAYFSQDVPETRLKLDIKPVYFSEERVPMIQASFNFHREVSQDEPSCIARVLSKWADYRRLSESIASDLAAEATERR